MLIKTFCAEVMGLEATTITIEVSLTRGVKFRLSGLADTAVKESYDRIRAAVQNVGFKLSPADLTINLSPADIRKEGSGEGRQRLRPIVSHRHHGRPWQGGRQHVT